MNIKGIRSKSAIPNKKEEMFSGDNYDFENYEQFINEENLNINKLGKLPKRNIFKKSCFSISLTK
jgi:hypothetical protein